MGEEMWLIWSNEHNAWWAPNSLGYTPSITKAGRYTLEDTRARTMHAGPMECGRPSEAIVPELYDDKWRPAHGDLVVKS